MGFVYFKGIILYCLWQKVKTILYFYFLNIKTHIHAVLIFTCEQHVQWLIVVFVLPNGTNTNRPRIHKQQQQQQPNTIRTLFRVCANSFVSHFVSLGKSLMKLLSIIHSYCLAFRKISYLLLSTIYNLQSTMQHDWNYNVLT